MFFHAVVADSQFSEISVIDSHFSLSHWYFFIFLVAFLAIVFMCCIVSSCGYCVLQLLDSLHPVSFVFVGVLDLKTFNPNTNEKGKGSNRVSK
jgi:hypothetical protein